MKRQKQRSKKTIIGLTGTFASGKSTVAKIFKRWKADVIDADKLAHSLLRSEVFRKKLVSIFGEPILNAGGSINKKKLSKLVFGKRQELLKLNQVMHPEIIRLVKGKIKSSQREIIVLDAPLLFEAGLRGLVNKVIVVKSKVSNLIKRAKKRDKLSKNEVLKRIKSQYALPHKIRMADFVIDNNGTFENTRKQLEQIRRILWRN